MADTGHKHNHPPQPTQAPPPSQALPLGAARGPVYPPTEQLQHLQFCIHSNPSWLESSMLAFQHYIVMLGTTVLIASTLVPLMGGSHGDKSRVIQTILFMSGLNTLLQTMIGSRLPTVMGASYAFVIPVLAIINDLRDEDFTSEHERFVHTMRTIQGSLIVCSFLNIILGFSKAWGNLTRLFSPLVLVPVVCVVGLGLFMRGFPLLANCVEIGLPMLILLVVIQQYLVRYLKHALPRGHYIVERFGLLFCIGIVWAFAAILTAAGAYNNVREQTKMSCRTDRSYLIQSAPWIKIPYPFQWGTPIFRASHVFGMIGAALVTSAESTGAFFAAARISGATPPPAHVLSRSIGLQGIFLLLEGIFGAAVGTTASVENVGLLGLTHIGSRRVVQISTAFMIFFSIFGKFGAFFASIPLPIFAAAYCVLLGIVAAVGISFIQFTNYNSLRNQYVLGLSLFLGISIPQYFVLKTNQTNGHGPVRTDSGWGGKGFRWGVKKFVRRIDIAGIEPIGLSLVAIYLLFYIMLKSKKIYLFLFVQFDNIVNTIFSSPPTVAIILGVLLDNTLEWKQTIQERGLPWLVPFQNRHGEARNAEFYGLPLRINEYMPTRFL